MTKIKELRKEEGKTQREIAAAIGVSAQVFRNYEIGRNQPSIEMLIKIADYFLVSVDYLIGRSDDLGIISFRAEEETLTEGERKILHRYRKLDESRKESLIEYADFLSEKTDK